MSTDELIGFNKKLFQGLCCQFISFVGVPTPAEISGTVILVDTTTSSAAQSAATSSKLL